MRQSRWRVMQLLNAWSSVLSHYKDTGDAYIFLYPSVALNASLPSTTSISPTDSLWSLPPQFFLSSPSSPWSQQLQLSSKSSTYSFHLFSYQTQLQSGNVVQSKLLNGEFLRMRILFFCCFHFTHDIRMIRSYIGMSALRLNKSRTKKGRLSSSRTAGSTLVSFWNNPMAVNIQTFCILQKTRLQVVSTSCLVIILWKCQTLHLGHTRS